MKQHYELGQMLRKRYNGFLSDHYNRYEVIISLRAYAKLYSNVLKPVGGSALCTLFEDIYFYFSPFSVYQ